LLFPVEEQDRYQAVSRSSAERLWRCGIARAETLTPQENQAVEFVRDGELLRPDRR